MTRLHDISRLVSAGLLVLAVSACDVHEFVDETAPVRPAAEILLHFNDGDMPLLATIDYDAPGRSRSAADGESDGARYIIQVYPAGDGTGSRAPSRSPEATVVITDRAGAFSSDRTVALDLAPGRYDVVAWADHVDAGSEDDKYYSSDDLSEIALVSATGKGDSRYVHRGNTAFREAYRGLRSITVAADGAVSNADGSPVSSGRAVVEMCRPLASFAFVTTDLAEFVGRSAADAPAQAPSPDPDDYRVVLRYTSYMPSVYNAFTDRPVNSRTGVYFDGAIARVSATEATLGSDYVFVNGARTSVQVALDVYSRADGSLLASTSPVDIPLERGRLTLVRGPFLTTRSGAGMGIDPGFTGDFNIEIR